MDSFSSIKKAPWSLVVGGILVFYLVTHLIGLVQLPVFADEAIYIRWAQLIIDDAARYAFFPLNDGKTPIFIWSLVPFLQSVENQLLAGRSVLVIIGLFQVIVMKELIAAWGGRRKAQLIGMLFTAILPFWFFYHRIALMDGMLTLFLSLTALFLVKLVNMIEEKQHQKKKVLFDVRQLFWMTLSGISFGLAILTKLPAIFFAPVFVLLAVLPWRPKIKWRKEILLYKMFLVGIAGVIGVVLFLLLKLHPAFGQLFLRGQNFTYSTAELLDGAWVSSLRNIPLFGNWLLFYLTPIVFFAPFLGLLDRKLTKRSMYLLMMAVIFAAPFVVFGKTVYPRYLLPVSIFFTVAGSLWLERMLDGDATLRMLAGIMLGVIGVWSIYNMSVSWIRVAAILFVKIDREQYESEWSAGYGVKEATEFILSQAQQGKVVVATEGYFGTLPDGILMNLHNQDVSNIEVFGIGQPIREIPEEFEMKAMEADFAYIMVNSHRMKVSTPKLQKVMSFSRPGDAPSFDIYQYTNQ
jgi:hypothetical protein